MKKLFYLLFISFVLASCTKEEPVEVVCTCGGASGISVDNALVGYWLEGDIGIFIGTDFSGNFYLYSYEFSGHYACDGAGHLSFIDDTGSGTQAESWTGNYSISGNVMTLNIVDGDSQGNYTLTKQ